jgi:hypothetical protein
MTGEPVGQIFYKITLVGLIPEPSVPSFSSCLKGFEILSHSLCIQYSFCAHEINKTLPVVIVCYHFFFLTDIKHPSAELGDIKMVFVFIFVDCARRN